MTFYCHSYILYTNFIRIRDNTKLNVIYTLVKAYSSSDVCKRIYTTKLCRHPLRLDVIERKVNKQTQLHFCYGSYSYTTLLVILDVIVARMRVQLCIFSKTVL